VGRSVAVGASVAVGRSVAVAVGLSVAVAAMAAAGVIAVGGGVGVSCWLPPSPRIAATPSTATSATPTRAITASPPRPRLRSGGAAAGSGRVSTCPRKATCTSRKSAKSAGCSRVSSNSFAAAGAGIASVRIVLLSRTERISIGRSGKSATSAPVTAARKRAVLNDVRGTSKVKAISSRSPVSTSLS